MKRLSSLIIAIVMMLSLGVSAFAAGDDGAEIDIRKSVAPDNYNYSTSINSDIAVMAEPEITTESKFIREIGGEKFDIRRNVAPDNYINYQLRSGTNSDEAAEVGSESTKQKELSLDSPLFSFKILLAPALTVRSSSAAIFFSHYITSPRK
ncbi:hypothetical protein FHR92_001931 [Fontibacillus solani]|uniref:WxL domain-containing protein n=1 Tax=Fontibacillus solani TaxID=1572857 RepID=A0A7W3SSN3_9BACL|nr:hypothetical protein [Fontibacillus solani]MBA9085465.1 hypothetical protein [Fontibacillus solani]